MNLDSKLVLSLSPQGGVKVFLLGKGKSRELMLKAFSKHIEKDLPRLKRSILSVLREPDANASPYLN